MPAISMTVNGVAVCGEVEGRTLLVEFIREGPASVALFDRGMNYLSVSASWTKAFGRGLAHYKPGDEVTLTTGPRVRWARAFVVFNASQVDSYTPTAPPAVAPEPSAVANWFSRIPARVVWGGGNPCYIPSQDRVLMPAATAFTTDTARALVRALGDSVARDLAREEKSHDLEIKKQLVLPQQSSVELF